MIDLIIFDLDGVLVDTERIHYESLIHCILNVTKLPMADLEGIVRQDGTTTKSKLADLKKICGIPDHDLELIDQMKQSIVIKQFINLTPNQQQIKMLEELKHCGKILAVGSNSRKENVNTILAALRIKDFFSFIVTQEDVIHSKPNPEMFIKIMNMARCSPESTLILEDSEAGQQAAKSSGANLLPINHINDTNIGYIKNELYKYYTNYSCADGRARI